MSQRFFIFIGAAMALLSAVPATAQAQNLYLESSVANSVGECNGTTGAVINASLITNLGNPQALAISGNDLYIGYPFGTNEGAVGEYNATTGAAINTSIVGDFNLSNNTPLALAISGNILYFTVFGNGSPAVVEYNTTTGVQSFLIQSLESPRALAISGGILYVADNQSGTVGEYNAVTGATINDSLITGLNNPVCLAVSGNTLYVNIDNGTVGEYNAITGATINESFINGFVNVCGLAISGTTLYVADNGSPKDGTGVVGSYNAITGAAINAFLIYPGPLPIAIAVSLPPPPVINSASSATGTDGFAFSYQIAASNNPTSFGATGLPGGLSVNTSTGLISGTPTVSGTFGVTISATNAGGTGSTTLTLTILSPLSAAPVITSALSVTGTSGFGFSYQITATNNSTSFGATGLPGGLSVNTATGLISGTPTVSGTFVTTISATNAGGTASSTLTLIVQPPLSTAPVITSALSVTGSEGSAFSYQIVGSNNPTSFGATGYGEGLPNGLSVNTSTGLISGTPTVSGSFFEDISASNSGGTGYATLNLTILPISPVIASGSTAYGTIGFEFNYRIYLSLESTSLFFPITFAATGLPPGLSVNASTGLISGTPTASGTFAATISAADAGGIGSLSLLLTVNINLAPLNGSYVGLGTVGGTNAALFTITMTSEGAFTGKLTLAGTHYPLKGTFSSYGAFNGVANIGDTTVGVVLCVGPSPPNISGTITASTADGMTSYTVESSPLGSFKNGTLPAGLAGRYTVIFPAASGTDSALPDAPGYGTMTVTPTGVVHIRGKLGDGTSFNTRGQMHADAKTWILFDRLYAGRHPGSVAGEVTFESSSDSDCDGLVDWLKPAQPTDAYYRGGFFIATDLLAATYASPPLKSGTAAFTLGGGNLPDAAITDSLTISAKNKVTVNGLNNGRITVTLTPRTEAFNGIFHYPGTNKETRFEGIIYQKPTPAGYGLFLGTDQCGGVEITP